MIKTKSNSLKFIINKISKTLVPKFFSFSKKEYLMNKRRILKKIYNYFSGNIILRSSAMDEDNEYLSNAGKYNSVLIKRNDFSKLNKKGNLFLTSAKMRWGFQISKTSSQ